MREGLGLTVLRIDEGANDRSTTDFLAARLRLVLARTASVSVVYVLRGTCLL